LDIVDGETFISLLNLHYAVDLVYIVYNLLTVLEEHLVVNDGFLVDVSWEVEGGFDILFHISLRDCSAVGLIVHIIGDDVVAEVSAEELVLQVELSIVRGIHESLVPALESCFYYACVCILNILEFECLPTLSRCSVFTC
jgi:hypothetical protein